jgi:hypothetical protein
LEEREVLGMREKEGMRWVERRRDFKGVRSVGMVVIGV